MSLLLVTTEVTLDIIILLSLRKYTVSYLNKCVNMPVPFIKTSANVRTVFMVTDVAWL